MANWGFIIADINYQLMHNTKLENAHFILQKRKNLEEIETQLKEEFIGLDEIIARVIQLITPWYLFPQIQQRPVIINLWGMTGVGKTSLVKRLMDLLQLNECFYPVLQQRLPQDVALINLRQII